MNKRRNRLIRKALPFFILFILLIWEGLIFSQSQIEKGKIFQELYPLITESDLYCSIFILEDRLPEIRIISSERENERILLTDSDIFYIDKGKKDGLEIGQIFLIIEVGKELGIPVSDVPYGVVAFKRGRATIVGLKDDVGIARVEKSCGAVMVGQFLVPFEEKEGLLGKDTGYDPLSQEEGGLQGKVIYVEREYNIAGSGHWAIIDLGKEDGVYVGQQMTISRKVKEGLPRQEIGNLVVIDTQRRTSTVKILSSMDAVERGFGVQAK